MTDDSPIDNAENVEEFGKHIAIQAAARINDGMSPGDVVGALCASVFATMKAAGLSDMQCSNAMHKLAEDMREKHLAERKRKH